MLSMIVCSGDKGEEEVAVVQLYSWGIWSENVCSYVMLFGGDVEWVWGVSKKWQYQKLQYVGKSI